MNVLVVKAIVAFALIGAGLTTPKRYPRARMVLFGLGAGVALGILHATNNGVD